MPYRTVSSFPNALKACPGTLKAGGNPEVFNVTGSPIESFGDDGSWVWMFHLKHK